MTQPPPEFRLVVFADDWGRHPSSAQHLVRELLPGGGVLWVNTLGTRRPRLRPGDLMRGARKLRDWLRPGAERRLLPDGLTVANPVMVPGFAHPWQRRLNAAAMARPVRRFTHNTTSRVTVGLTTLPILADLVTRQDLGVDRWVYYAVDDFSKWPGADQPVMDAMERELVGRVDAVVCVSETLRQRAAGLGRDDTTLLTHGVDLDHWSIPASPRSLPGRCVFWGLVDARLDPAWCAALGDDLALVGPAQDPPPGLSGHRVGSAAYENLPGIAAGASVLVMPYADLAVTRAMQPLKLKEYLAAGYPDRMRPVVVRDLPATRGWADCCDVVDSAEAFAETCRSRAAGGLPESQRKARLDRLAGESWSEKAKFLQSVLAGQPIQGV